MGSGAASEIIAAADNGAPFALVHVAFSGHSRPADLGDPEAASRGLEIAFARLAQAGVVNARLLTGLAPGADRLAAARWRAAGLGSVHAVFPFLDDAPEGEVCGLMDSAAWLDGDAARRAGRNPHLSQARWLIGSADLLVAVWTGHDARGAGGTAEAVRLALEHGIPVLWISPVEPDEPWLISPEHLDDDFGFLEFLEGLRARRAPLVQHATADALRAVLLDRGLQPGSAASAESGPAAPDAEGLPFHGRIYGMFRRALGGRAPPSRPSPPPPDLAAQPGFARLSRAREAASREARRLGAIHRSHQVVLLVLAILAATAGAGSAVWPHLKIHMVSLELALALCALLVWRDSEREQRHHRWGAARRLAEELRLERAAWSVGVATTPHRLDAPADVRARDARRAAGLPEGRFDRERVRTWGGWAVDELIAGQAAYHRAQATTDGHISHRLHQLENVSFGVLMLLLTGYLVAAGVGATVGHKPPQVLASAVFMAGAVVPAIAAACLALEATLSLTEQTARSRQLAERLQRIGATVDGSAGLEALQAAIRSAIRLERAQEQHWADDASRRRLFRGG